jgi:hypothetical protein
VVFFFHGFVLNHSYKVFKEKMKRSIPRRGRNKSIRLGADFWKNINAYILTPSFFNLIKTT